MIRGAFGSLVERYVKLVHGVVFEAVRRPEEVEDLSQDVFCKAYLELTKLRDHAKFAAMAGKDGRQHLYRLACAGQQVRRRPQLEGVVREGVLDAILPPTAEGEGGRTRKLIQKEDFARR